MNLKFKKLVQLLLLTLALVFTTACDFTRQVQAQTASGIAGAANAALPVLLTRYDAEGETEIMKVKQEGGTAAQARAAVELVKQKWEPVWKAWEVLRAAQGLWADALESDGNFMKALLALKNAYCGLRKVWPDEIPAVPLAPLKCAEVTP